MISVICSSQHPLDDFQKHVLSTSGLGKHIEFIGYENNGEFSLTQIYNRGLKEAKYDVVVFIHHDITFDSKGWGNKLLTHFDNNPKFGILGLAGTTNMPASGKWWEDNRKMVGIVNHQHEGKKWESRYSKDWGNDLVEVAIVDGLFFAVHRNRIKTIFSEDVKGFHFYEIDFVLGNYMNGVKVGVIFNVRVTHASIGATNAEWDTNRHKFIQRFANHLPVNFVPPFYHGEGKPPTVFPRIKVIVQLNGVANDSYALYRKIMSFEYPNLEIYWITDGGDANMLNNPPLEGVTLFDGESNSLAKNLEILKNKDGFLTKKDDLVFFMTDKIQLVNNIFNSIVKIYIANKQTFGGAFPLSYNLDGTVFCSKLSIFANKEDRVAIDMKDVGTYYNVFSGYHPHPIGNIADCFATTATNLRIMDWFSTDYVSPLCFNDFALRAYIKNKMVFNDSNALTVQNSFAGDLDIKDDFQKIITLIGSHIKLEPLVKRIE